MTDTLDETTAPADWLLEQRWREAPEDAEAGRRYLQSLLERGDRAQALEVCRQINASRTDLDLMFLEARLLGAGGDLQQSLRVTEELLAQRPDAAPALDLLLGLQVVTEDNAGALKTAELILSKDPDNLAALVNQSAALLNTERGDDCMAVADRVIGLAPQRPEGYLNKAAVLMGLGLAEAALQVCEQGLLAVPRHPELESNRIAALLELERPQEALSLLERIPDAGDNLYMRVHRADCRLMLGFEEEYIDDCLEMLLEPDAPEWLGEQLIRGLLKEAPLSELLGRVAARARAGTPAVERLVVAALEQLLTARRYREVWDAREVATRLAGGRWQVRPMQMIAGAGLGLTEEVAGFFGALTREEAVRLDRNYEAGWEHLPDDCALLGAIDAQLPRADYLLKRLGACDWAARDGQLRELKTLIDNALAGSGRVPVRPHFSIFLPIGQSLRRRIAEREAALVERFVAGAMPKVPTPDPGECDGRLKIGYVSADFRSHATAHLIRNLFRMHDRQRFEIYGYGIHPGDDSEYNANLTGGLDRFVPLSQLSNAEAAQRIRDDGIHILIDLQGYTLYSRAEIFAQRPAPIQIEFLAYPGTTGAPYIDYIIADRTVLPEEAQQGFSEKPIYLPDCYQSNDRWQPISEFGFTREMLGLPEQGVVYCVFNSVQKLAPDSFGCWLDILREVDGSVLWLMDPGAEAAENLRTFTRQRGIDPDRLHMAPRMPKAHHLARSALADLYLDTWLVNGHTSASDALWAGVPVLTLEGKGFAGRVGASLLRAMDMDELIAATADRYLATAVALGRDPARLAALRRRVRENRLTTPLFDTERYTRNLEAGFEAAWRRHKNGEPPAAMDVSAGSRSEEKGPSA